MLRLTRMLQRYSFPLVFVVLGGILGGVSSAGSPTAVADAIHYTVTGLNSVTFDWRGSATTISYGTTTAYGTTVTATGPVVVKEDGTNVPITPNSGSGPWREARLTGLQTGTTYHYSIGGLPDKTFHTEPAAGSSGFMVAAEGDIGNPSGFPDMQTIQNMIAGAGTDMVLGLGDYPYDNGTPTDGEIDAFFGDSSLGASKNGIEAFSTTTPFMPTWGNHEMDHANDNGTCTGDNPANYKSRFDFPHPMEDPVYSTYCNTGGGEDWWWVDYGNTRFIGYPEPWSDDWRTWDSKVDPIMAQAQNDPSIKFIVILGHRPAWSSGYHPGETALANYIAALHTKYSKFVLQLSGHSHDYERTDPTQTNGVIDLTVGTGGGYLENAGCSNGWNTVNGSCNKPAWSAVRFMRYGYEKLSFSDTAITGQFVCGPPGGDSVYDSCTQGSVIDTFTINAPGGGGGGGGDTTPPTASLTAPANGATVTGTTTVTATASDNVGVSRVELLVDGTSVATDTSSPYSFSWNSTTVADGSHTLQVKAYDAAGNVGSSTTITTTVSNAPVCTNNPSADRGTGTITVTVPAAGSYRVWSQILAPDSTNNSYFIQIDSGCPTVVGDSASITPNSWTWVDYKDGTTSSPIDVSLTAGIHTVKLIGREDNVGVDRVIFTSDTACIPTGNGDNCAAADTTPPTAGITSPANNATVSGTVTINASATDNVGVARVDFLVDGAVVGSKSTSPYTFQWNTAGVALSNHTLTVKAYDAANNSQTSTSVTVKLVDASAPTVSLTAPANGSIVAGAVTLSATATDNYGVAHVDFIVDGTVKSSDTTSPYSYSWNSTAVSDGSHTLQAKAYDSAGNTSTSTVKIAVQNTAPPTKVGDLNNDGKVDIFDLSILISKWGKSGTNADLNHDGTVNIFDLSILISKWGT